MIFRADDVEFWSHHEKVVVVDNHYACIGGLDLCFGRWDTHSHPLADVHPANPFATLFPGQDYNNARIMDFQDVPNYVSNGLSSIESGRMPWHDVHMTLTGEAVLDIVQHYVERWNEVKKRKVRGLLNGLLMFAVAEMRCLRTVPCRRVRVFSHSSSFP